MDNFVTDGLTVLNYPFKRQSVTSISINMIMHSYTGRVEWYARVNFANGSTSGTQAFDDFQTFDECVRAVDAFLKTL